MKLIINRKDHKILLMSNITKDYPTFLHLIRTNEKITDPLIQYQSKKMKNFIVHMLPLVLQQAILEWKAKEQIPQDLGEDKHNWTVCSLCGQPNRYIHYIRNSLTGEVINVGSECVKEYEFVEGNTEQQRRAARRLRRLNLLNNEIPGINKIMDNWKLKTESYDVWIPISISRKYDVLGEKLGKLYDEFLSSKAPENTITILRDIIRQADNEIIKFKKYSDSKINNPFAITSVIFRWMKRDFNSDNVKTIYEQVKDNGMITYKVAHRITEESFMKKTVKLLGNHLKRIGVVLTKELVMEKQYQVKFSELDQCNLYVSHQELLINFGWKLFDEKPYTDFNKIEVIKSCVVKDEHSIDNLIKTIGQQLFMENVTVIGYDYDFNELVIFNRRQDEHKVFQLKSFISRFKTLAIHRDLELIYELNTVGRTLESIRDYEHDRVGYIKLV